MSLEEKKKKKANVHMENIVQPILTTVPKEVSLNLAFVIASIDSEYLLMFYLVLKGISCT